MLTDDDADVRSYGLTAEELARVAQLEQDDAAAQRAYLASLEDTSQGVLTLLVFA